MNQRITILCFLVLGLLLATKSHAQGVAPSNQAVREAQQKLSQATAALEEVTKLLKKEAMSNHPEWSAAREALDEAQKAYDETRKEILEELQADPEYQQAIRAKQAGIRLRDEVRANPNATQEQFAQAAAAIIKATQAMDALEKEAMEENETIVTAKAIIEENKEKVAEFERQFTLSLEILDPYIEAKRAVETAEQELAAARVAAAQARDAEGKQALERRRQEVEQRRQERLNRQQL